jgi:hypothetical protein
MVSPLWVSGDGHLRLVEGDGNEQTELQRRLFRSARAKRCSYFPGIHKVDISFSAISVVMGPTSGSFSTRSERLTEQNSAWDRRLGNSGIGFLELVSLLGRQSGLRKTVDDPLDILLSLER